MPPPCDLPPFPRSSAPRAHSWRPPCWRKAFEGAREVIGWRLQGDLALRGAPDQAGGTAIKPSANAGALHSTRDHIMMRQHGNGNTMLRNDKAIPQTISDNPPPQCPKQLATGNTVAHGHMDTTTRGGAGTVCALAWLGLRLFTWPLRTASAAVFRQANTSEEYTVHGMDHAARHTTALLWRSALISN